MRTSPYANDFHKYLPVMIATGRRHVRLLATVQYLSFDEPRMIMAACSDLEDTRFTAYKDDIELKVRNGNSKT